MESSKEKNENEVVNMCFMALEDHEDELNSSTINDELQNVFEELYLDFEKLALKNTFLKKKISSLENKFND